MLIANGSTPMPSQQCRWCSDPDNAADFTQLFHTAKMPPHESREHRNSVMDAVVTVMGYATPAMPVHIVQRLLSLGKYTPAPNRRGNNNRRDTATTESRPPNRLHTQSHNYDRTVSYPGAHFPNSNFAPLPPRFNSQPYHYARPPTTYQQSAQPHHSRLSPNQPQATHSSTDLPQTVLPAQMHSNTPPPQFPHPHLPHSQSIHSTATYSLSSTDV